MMDEKRAGKLKGVWGEGVGSYDTVMGVISGPP
jgi:hypothetical protein